MPKLLRRTTSTRPAARPALGLPKLTKRDKQRQTSRILVKLSGEFLGNPKDKISANNPLNFFISQIKDIKKNTQLEIAVVIGAGNIVRGLNAQKLGLDRYTSDYMGMIGTLINALHLKNILRQNSIKSSIMSALEIKNICPLFYKERALKFLERGDVVILAGGTGNPYFSTDTAAALRAVELNVDILLKATKVDGVYDCDPMINPKAKKFKQLTYQQVLEKNLKVMDLTAISLCKENNIPIIVCDIKNPHSIKKILKGEKV
ncbi:MAG: UMP kinase, partial [Candidatus Omnitrophota bacterium]